MIIDPSGFANAVNNLPGYRVTSVAVNGADLDILLWRSNNTLIAEAAAGARDIRVVCQSIYTYCAGANIAGFCGYTDWRIPSDIESLSLRDMEAGTAYPNIVAFPDWLASTWTSTTVSNSTAQSMYVFWTSGVIANAVKTSAAPSCLLVRG
jgi:hypothetical protein